MTRKFSIRKPKELENIMKDGISRVGITGVTEEKSALLLRLVISGIANYFFKEPDNIINLGYMQFIKEPDKEELFRVKILKNESQGVVNANTLWRYYKGELASEAELKEIIDKFVDGLLDYSQNQETKINKLTRKLNK